MHSQGQSASHSRPRLHLVSSPDPAPKRGKLRVWCTLSTYLSLFLNSDSCQTLRYSQLLLCVRVVDTLPYPKIRCHDNHMTCYILCAPKVLDVYTYIRPFPSLRVESGDETRLHWVWPATEREPLAPVRIFTFERSENVAIALASWATKPQAWLGNCSLSYLFRESGTIVSTFERSEKVTCLPGPHSSIMQPPAVRGVAYRTVCICACCCHVPFIILLLIFLHVDHSVLATLSITLL